MVATWLKHANQKCWNCMHFQRYDTATEDLTKAYGDCRKETTGGFLAYNFLISEFWPVIPDGRYHWCGQWKQSFGLFIPAEPVNPVPFDWPTDWFEGELWNVKDPINISCWNCNHFQREDEIPGPEDIIGQCRKTQPPPATEIILGVESDSLLGRELNILGPLFWCGHWEKSQEPVPLIVNGEVVQED